MPAKVGLFHGGEEEPVYATPYETASSVSPFSRSREHVYESIDDLRPGQVKLRAKRPSQGQEEARSLEARQFRVIQRRSIHFCTDLVQQQQQQQKKNCSARRPWARRSLFVPQPIPEEFLGEFYTGQSRLSPK